MFFLTIIGSIMVYTCIGAFVCGAYDEFIEMDRYLMFWPFIVIEKTIRKLFE